MKLSSSLLCYLLQELPPVCALFIPLLYQSNTNFYIRSYATAAKDSGQTRVF